MKITLEITEGPESGRRLLLETGEECIVGRVDGDFVLGQDRLISGRHMFLKNDGTTLLVTDLNSRNHVYINGKQIEPNLPIAVKNGSEIVAGRKTKIRVFVQKSRLTPVVPESVQEREESKQDYYATKPESRHDEEAEHQSPVDRSAESSNGSTSSDDSADLTSSKFIDKSSVFRKHAKPKPAPANNQPASEIENYVERDSSPGTSPGTSAGVPKIATPENDSRPAGGSSNFTDSFYQPRNVSGSGVSGDNAPGGIIPGHDSHRPSLIASSSFSMIEDNPPRFTKIRMDNGVWLFQGLPEANSIEAVVVDLLTRLTEVPSQVFSVYPASANLSSPTAYESATPLFDWIPEQVARMNGPLLVNAELVTDKREIAANWNTESVVTFLGTDIPALTNWLTKLVRLNTKTGERGKTVFGLCWPGILETAIEEAGKAEAKLIFGAAIAGILIEDGAREFAWKLYSKDDLSQQLSILGLVAEND